MDPFQGGGRIFLPALTYCTQAGRGKCSWRWGRTNVTSELGPSAALVDLSSQQRGGFFIQESFTEFVLNTPKPHAQGTQGHLILFGSVPAGLVSLLSNEFAKPVLLAEKIVPVVRTEGQKWVAGLQREGPLF